MRPYNLRPSRAKHKHEAMRGGESKPLLPQPPAEPVATLYGASRPGPGGSAGGDAGRPPKRRTQTCRCGPYSSRRVQLRSPPGRFSQRHNENQTALTRALTRWAPPFLAKDGQPLPLLPNNSRNDTTAFRFGHGPAARPSARPSRQFSRIVGWRAYNLSIEHPNFTSGGLNNR